MNAMNDLEAEGLALLDGQCIDTEDTTSYGLTSNKEYHRLVRYQNVTSYSQLTELHACPRRLQLNKYYAGTGEPEENLDFAFGHSVGAGVQSLFLTRNMQTALFNSFMAWNITFDFRIRKKKKSIWEAAIAVEKFWPFLTEHLAEWEIVTLSNGRQGVELSFSLDCANGYKHYGHIDVVLRNKDSGEIAVIELKTTGFKTAEESLYANSSQALGYSIILDALFPGLSSYEVFHFIYSSTDREWTPMPFTKTTAHKAEWIQDLLLDHANMEKYEELKFYPKRGESCYDYFRRCKYYGTCNIVPDTELPRLGMEEEAEIVDFQLSLAEIVKAQQNRLSGRTPL